MGTEPGGQGRRGLDAHSLAPGTLRPHSPAWRGPLPPASPRLSLSNARLSGSPSLRLVPCAGFPAVRSCRRALLWPRCAHAALLAAAAGAGPQQGRAGGDTARKVRVGSVAPSPPTGVSHPPHSQIRGKGALESCGESCKGE